MRWYFGIPIARILLIYTCFNIVFITLESTAGSYLIWSIYNSFLFPKEYNMYICFPLGRKQRIEHYRNGILVNIITNEQEFYFKRTITFMSVYLTLFHK